MLAALEPSLRRIGATALIILTTMIYGVLNAAMEKKTSKQMSEALLGEQVSEKIQQITKDFPCERDVKMAAIAVELSEDNYEARRSVRNNWLLANLLVLFICAYISSCIILPRKLSSNAT